MIPIKKVVLQDKTHEKVLNDLFQDIYTHLGGVKAVQEEHLTAIKQLSQGSGTSTVVTPEEPPIIPPVTPPIVVPAFSETTFTMPWKMTGLKVIRKTLSGATYTTYTVPKGSVFQLYGYHLAASGGAGHTADIFTYTDAGGTNTVELVDNTNITRSPQYCNGLFISSENGGRVTIEGNNAASSGWFIGREFNWDPAISTKKFYQNYASPYVVPTGKIFVLTYAFFAALPGGLEESSDGGTTWATVLEYNAGLPTVNPMFSIGQHGHVLMFPAGTLLRCDDAGGSHAIILFGYEIAAI
jgi:hypothetical protein